MWSIRRAALFALSVFFVSNVVAEDRNGIQIGDAKVAELAAHPYWQRLLHYANDGDGVVSMAGGKRLFISANGATNSVDELRATLAALSTNQYLETRDEKALCAFPARFRWLKAELKLSDADFPKYECEARERWRKELNPVAATLVFPDAYISSPGSMFGHTLLRVDGAPSGARAGLLAYAVNYAADVRGVGAVEYAVKGITGGFPGFFGLFPYYTKVKEYAWIEQRDIWEYPLNLSELELTRLLEHLWELKMVPFKYYFFDKNCSWQLLALLEIARPGAELTKGFELYAIPVDTVRRLQDQSFVSGAPHLRPSRQRELDAARQQMSTEQQDHVSNLVSGTLSPTDAEMQALPPADQVLLLDSAYELLHSGFRQGAYERDEALPRAHAILSARSKLGQVAATPLNYEVTAPDQAHESTRWGLGAGNDEMGNWAELNFRPAFHDLLDADKGFLPGYSIDFGRIRLRQYFSPGKLRLDEFTILSATSRSVWTRWSRPASWRFGLGFIRPAWIRAVDADPKLGLYLSGEAGASFGGNHNHLFLGVSANAHWGRLLNKDGRIAVGPKLATKLKLADNWSATASWEKQYAVSGLKLDSSSALLGLQWQLNRANGLRLEARHSELGSTRSEREAKLTWFRYF